MQFENKGNTLIIIKIWKMRVRREKNDKIFYHYSEWIKKNTKFNLVKKLTNMCARENEYILEI